MKVLPWRVSAGPLGRQLQGSACPELIPGEELLAEGGCASWWDAVTSIQRPDGMESAWGCCSELSLAGPCGGSARAAALQGWVENQQPRKTPELLRQQLEGGWKKQTPVGFQGSVGSSDPSASQCRVQSALGCAICQNLWLCLASKASVASPSSLDTC